MPSKEEVLKRIHGVMEDAANCKHMESKIALKGTAFSLASLAVQLGLLSELDYDNLVAQYIG